MVWGDAHFDMLLFRHDSRMRQTDRQTDGRTVCLVANLACKYVARPKKYIIL